MMIVFRGRVLFLLLLIANFVELKIRIWRFDTDIANPTNWVDNKLASNCKGVHFSPVNSAPIYITQLTTSELTLPVSGEIDIIDGGFIDFKDNKKCIKLKALNYHDWYDPSSWSQSDDNVAIPDKEQIPCTDDDVVFPNIYHSRVSENYGGDITVRSVKFEKEQQRLETILTSNIGHQIFNNPYGEIPVFVTSRQKCEDPYGCLCHKTYIPCPTTTKEKKLNCLDPIIPEESCSEMCGAYITYNLGNGPTLDEIREKLKEYSADTYASRVRNYVNSEIIQIVFSEKEYTGKSLEEAQNFLQYLKSSNVPNVQFLKSDEFHIEERNSTVGIVFGTFALVAIFFGILLYMHGDAKITTLIRTLQTTKRGSVFNSPFFARFDNTDENLIIDGQSELGSILDIPKSFDNPLYGQNTPCTSTTSIQHENPLYDAVQEEKNAEAEE